MSGVSKGGELKRRIVRLLKFSAMPGLISLMALLMHEGAVTSGVRSEVGPIILWGVEPNYAKPAVPAPTTKELAEGIRAGMSWIQTYGGVKVENRDDSVAAFLDGLLALRLRVIASVEHIAGGQLDTVFITRKILKWRDHPAIGAWELVDEPEIKGVTPTDLRRAYALCKRLDPARGVVVVWAPVAHRSSYESAGRVFDWGMIDIYPLNVAGYDSTIIPRAVAELKDRVAFEERPLTPILQAFDDAHHRVPDIVTLTRMAQQFHAAGATEGLALYNWNADQTKQNLGGTGLWRDLLRTAALRRLSSDAP